MAKNKHDKKSKAPKGKGKHLPDKIEKAPKPPNKGKGAKPSKSAKVREPELDGAAQAKAVIDDPTSSKKAIKAAERFLAENHPKAKNKMASKAAEAVEETGAGSPVDTSAIDAKLKAQRAARKLLDRHLGENWTTVGPEAIDLADHPLVSAWNLIRGVETGHFLTSTEEVEAAVASISKDAPMPTVAQLADEHGKRVPTKPKAKGKKADQDATSAPLSDEPTAQVAEEVETEKGREFAVGAVEDAETLIPHNIVGADEDTGIARDHLGRPKVEYVNEKGETKTKSYTRVTTYIDCLEDKTQLEKWKMRTLLEGAGLELDEYRTDAERDLADSLVGQARRATEVYERDLAKIDKDQRKGKLDLGQYGLRRQDAKKVHDDALNELTQTALDLGGVHERAQKGTDLHAWTERYDKSGLSISEFINGYSTQLGGDLDDVTADDLRAYAAKMTELNIEHVSFEQFVVVDSLGIAGTLDRASLFKFPGSGRRVRCVADIKTGRIDYSAGKIGMQLLAYANGEAYDHTLPLAERRSPLKLSKTQALLIHLPQGEARCEVYVVDIALAATGLALARQVREWRNTGKRVYSTANPVTAEATA